MSAVEQMKKVHTAVERMESISQRYQVRGVANTFAESDYAGEFEKFVTRTQKELKDQGITGPEMPNALQALKSNVERIYDNAVTNSSLPWTQSAWDQAFAPAKKQLTDLSASSTASEQAKKWAAQKAEELETFKTKKFEDAASALANSVDRQVGLNHALGLNKELREQYGLSRPLPKPVSLTPKDEKDIQNEDDPKGVLKWVDKEDDLRRKMQKFRDSKDRYYRCMSGAFKGRLIEYTQNGCRPKPIWVSKTHDKNIKGLWEWTKNKVTGKEDQELFRAGYAAAMDVMQFKDPGYGMTFGLPVISNASANDGGVAKMKEMLFTSQEFTADYIRKNILAIFEEAQLRNIPLELDDDLRNYMIRVRDNDRKEFFDNTRHKVAVAFDQIKNAIPIVRHLIKDRSRDTAIQEVLDKAEEMRDAARKEKVIGKTHEQMEERVKDAKDKLEQPPSSDLKGELKEAYDAAHKQAEAEMDSSAGKPVIASAPLKPEEELSEQQRKKKIDEDAISKLNKTAHGIDPDKSIDEKIGLIEQGLKAIAAQLKVAVKTEEIISGQMGVLKKPAHMQTPASMEWREAQVQKLEELRALQEQKLQDLSVKAKLLHHAAKTLTGASKEKQEELVGTTANCLTGVSKTLEESRVHAKATIENYQHDRKQEKAKAEAQQAKAGGPSGPAPK